MVKTRLPTKIRIKKGPRYQEPMLESINHVMVQEDPDNSKVYYEFDLSNLEYNIKKEEYLIIGIDTEYKVPTESLKNFEVKDKNLNKYTLLSYQFFAHHYDGSEWNGIALSQNGERMTMAEFIVFVIAKGVSEGAVKTVPRKIYLVGHYNRADIPAFEDRDDLIKRLNNLRKSIVTYDMPIKVKINGLIENELHLDAHKKTTVELERERLEQQDFEGNILHVYIRDSILLAPQSMKSLAALGELVGIPKIVLSEDKKIEKHIKENMDELLRDNWPLFKLYALADAEICVKYFLKIVEQYENLTGTKHIPSALSNMGIKLLLNGWKKRDGVTSPEYIVGKELIIEPVWNEKTQQFNTKKKKVYLEEIHWFTDFVTECYHGGRNETFWFGPSFIDDWCDFDLTSAYPTVMALINQPKWEQIRPTSDLNDFKLNCFSFACVDFRFNQDVRYPCLPVRSANGVIFPLSGRSYCSSPEIVAALNMGCDIKIRHGVVIPTDPNDRVFFPFIKGCIDNRLNAKSEIEKQFWKELTNSSYGKTAQGLTDKRVFNLQDRESRRLPPSDLTNPYYAAYITSYVRAVVSEIISSIPKNKIVFSVTTDGFITNSNANEMKSAQSGPLCKEFSRGCLELRGNPEVLSEKHFVKQVLGWRTRGQATIKIGNKDKIPQIVLAKAGIQSPFYSDSVTEQNQHILDLFFKRNAETDIEFSVHTSMRDMVLHHADLVNKASKRKVSMEYDFKRKPYAVTMVKGEAKDFGINSFEHIAFDTMPWKSIEDFKTVRLLWSDYDSKLRRPIKTIETFKAFAEFYDTRNSLPFKKQKYLRHDNLADLKRLKRDLCRAFAHGHAGLDHYSSLTANEFMLILKQSGFGSYNIKCERAEIERSKRFEFEPNSTPPTDKVLEVINSVKKSLPLIEIDEILNRDKADYSLLAALDRTPINFK